MTLLPFYVDLDQTEILPQLANPVIVGSIVILAKFDNPIDRYCFHDLIEGGFVLFRRRMEEY
jgi:hypothetical protein